MKRPFQEILPFDTQRTAKLPSLSKLKKPFFPKIPSVCEKKPKILKILKNVTFQVPFCGKLATFGNCIKIQDFFSKSSSISVKNPQILNSMRNLTESNAFCGKFAKC